MYEYDYDYMDYMRKMKMPEEYSPMMEMPQENLESMYPRSYHIVNPEVERSCGMMHMKYGPMYMPNRQQVESMVDEIDNRVGPEIDAEYQDDEGEERQFGFGGFGGRRRFRRDLITILLLRRLFRRRRPHFGFPGFGGFGF
jgi:hypothetical protein